MCARNENETIHKILRDERDKVRSENKRLREALEKIAKQMIGNELDEEYGSADFQYAYETLVREARAALSDGAKP